MAQARAKPTSGTGWQVATLDLLLRPSFLTMPAAGDDGGELQQLAWSQPNGRRMSRQQVDGRGDAVLGKA